MPFFDLPRISWHLPGLALLLACLGGCSSLNSALGGTSEQQALTQVQWNYGSAALRLEISSDAALNSYDGEAHSVVLAVVQTSEPEAFYQFLETPDIVAKVLQGTRGPAGLLQTTRYAIEPGRKAKIRLDRAQGAHYVGVIVAFYDVPVAKTAKLFNLPVDVSSSGIVVREHSAAPALAGLNLKLGADSIVEAKITALPAEKPGKGEVAPTPNTVGALKLNDVSEP